MGNAGTVELDVVPGGLDKFGQGLGNFAGQLGLHFGALEKLASNSWAKIAAGGALVAVAAYKIGETFDNAYDTIRIGTGATGKELEGLEGDFRSVVHDVPVSFGEAATAIAGVNEKLHLSGPLLQERTKQIAELSRLTKTDLNSNLDASAVALNNWNLKGKAQGTALEELFRLTQKTGVGFAQLAQDTATGGAVARTAGLSFEQTASFVALLSQNGIQAGPVWMSLGRAIAEAAKEGRPAADVLRDTFDAIKGAPDATSAAGVAIDTFGQRAGPKLAALIREGKVEYADLARTITQGGDTIHGAAGATDDFAEKWRLLKNRLLLDVEPVMLTIFDTVGDIAEAFTSMPDWVQKFIIGGTFVALAVTPLVKFGTTMATLVTGGTTSATAAIAANTAALEANRLAGIGGAGQLGLFAEGAEGAGAAGIAGGAGIATISVAMLGIVGGGMLALDAIGALDDYSSKVNITGKELVNKTVPELATKFGDLTGDVKDALDQANGYLGQFANPTSINFADVLRMTREEIAQMGGAGAPLENVRQEMKKLEEQTKTIGDVSIIMGTKFVQAASDAGIPAAEIDRLTEILNRSKVAHDDDAAAAQRLAYSQGLLSGTITNTGGVITDATGAVIGYATSFGFIPASKNTDITNTADTARFLAGLYQGALNQLNGVSINTPVNANTGPALAALRGVQRAYAAMGAEGSSVAGPLGAVLSAQGYAKGGTPGVGELAWVGEHGPELKRFSGSETIIPHDRSMAYATAATRPAPGSAAPIMFTVPNYGVIGNKRDAEEFIASAYATLRQQGKVP